MASVCNNIFLRMLWRAKKRNTPLGAVIDAPSGYMIVCTAEQKICPGKFFGCVGSHWGIPKGCPLGSALLPLQRGKGSAARHERNK